MNGVVLEAYLPMRLIASIWKKLMSLAMAKLIWPRLYSFAKTTFEPNCSVSHATSTGSAISSPLPENIPMFILMSWRGYRGACSLP